MALVFFAGSGSPFAWRIHLALEHKKVPYELRMLSFSAGDLRKPEFLALNPRHKVPTILDGDFSLYESSPIGEYLEERFPEHPLFPRDQKQRAIARRIVAEVGQYFYEASRPLTTNLFFKKESDWKHDEIAAGKKAALEEVEYFSDQIKGEFLMGAEPGIADYALYPMIATFARFEKKKPDLGLRSDLPPKIGPWMKRIESLPYFDKTYPPHWRG